VIIGRAVRLIRVITAIVFRRPVPWTVSMVDETPEDERHHWTEEEIRNAKGQ
jgi:hypothetical protein